MKTRRQPSNSSTADVSLFCQKREEIKKEETYDLSWVVRLFDCSQVTGE